MRPDAASTPAPDLLALMLRLANARAERNRCQQAYQESQRLVVRLRLELAAAIKRERVQAEEAEAITRQGAQTEEDMP